MKKNKLFGGFTLIELLVVLSVLGILFSLVIARYLSAEKQARDVSRKNDLKQIQIALENYAGTKSLTFPVGSGSVGTLCTTLTTGDFISSCPVDPRDFSYLYFSDGANYLFGATLETGGYWEICSGGKVGRVSNLPADVNCDL